MTRRAAFLLAMLAAGSALPLPAQRARLGVRGRQQDPVPASRTAASCSAEAGARQTGDCRPVTRRYVVTVPQTFDPQAIDLFIAAEMAKLPPPPALPEDRVRPVLRREGVIAATTPLIPEPLVAYDTLPDRPEQVGMVDGLPPQFAVPEVPGEPQVLTNRWRIELPGYRRYADRSLDALPAARRWWDPFNRNVVKGDFPIQGRNNFLAFTGSSDTLLEIRRVPVPSVASAARALEPQFFGKGEQFITRQSFRLSFDLFRGSAGFRPVDAELRVTPEFNINFINTRENGLTRIDVRERTNRLDTTVAFQELFFEKRLFSNSTSTLRPRSAENPDDGRSAYFDFTSLRAGIQRFTSDFRGFIFSDEQLGTRLFGTLNNNIFQYNLAFFDMLEKDTNSGLNRWRRRNQKVYIANFYWQDFLAKGYNVNVSYHYNNDQPTFHIDKNGFIVRPAPIGDPVPHKIRAHYVGVAGDGHIGRINYSNAFYYVAGRDSANPIPAPFPLGAGQKQVVSSSMAALEVAYERDWLIYKTSFFFSQGDKDINDGRGTGFDAIVPNQQFAGGGFLGLQAAADRGLINQQFEGGGVNFLNRQPFPLTGTALLLFGPNSLLPNLRSSPFQGQANFLNPGILLANVGVDAKLTPKLRSTININYLRFHRTEVLEALLFQGGIRKSIGFDSGFGLQYRPKLSDNIVITGGFGVLVPHQGFKNLFNGRSLLSGFVLTRFLF